jgi:hypothetical protein
MEIIRCHICGHGFSRHEMICPRCQTRRPAPSSTWRAIIFAAVVAIVLGLIWLAIGF